MKKILLTILSLFVLQINSADSTVVLVAVRDCPDIPLEEIRVKLTDTVKDVFNNFSLLHNFASDIDIKGSITSYGKPLVPVNPEQTVLEVVLHESYNYILIENPLIDITCRTLTGLTFTITTKIFNGLHVRKYRSYIATLIEDYLRDKLYLAGIEDERLKEIYKNLFHAVSLGNIKLIHRGKELPLDSCPFQIQGLLADPNITIIIQPRRR